MSEVSQEFKAYCVAFTNFQKEVQNASKDGTGNRNAKYATITSILDAIKEPLTNNGLSFSQAITSTESGYKVKTTIRHVEGFSEIIELDAPTMKITDAQALGSLTTYLRRYSLVSVFGIGAEDDDCESATANNYHNNQSQQNQSKNNNVTALTEERLNKAIGLIMNEQDINKLDNLLMAVSKQGANDQQYKRATNAYNKRKETLSKEAFNNA